AVALIGFNQIFGSPLSHTELNLLARSLGSDVPFFLQDRPALGVGRGEQVKSLQSFTALQGKSLVLIHPGFGVSTAWAYKNLARFPEALNGRAGRVHELVSELRSAKLESAAPKFYNSLEAPALEKFPILALFQEFLGANGA